MAVNIFEKYGIKEVANVYFEALEDDLAAGVYKGDVVLFLDSLKVSTIEQTAESADARGGWGNPKLVSWDYGREINVTLEDALMSLESLRFMLGGAIKRPKSTAPVVVRHTEQVVCTTGGVVPLPKDHLTDRTLTPKATYGHPIRLINLTTGVRTQLVVEQEGGQDITLDGTKAIKFKNPAAGVTTEVATKYGDVIRIFWEEIIANETGAETAVEVVISPNTFPGTYKVVGDTFMRSEKTGKDEPFQFIISKAKVLSDVTITLEAEGDPSTFEMQLSALRATNEQGENEMMKLVRYGFTNDESVDDGDDHGSVAE